MERGDGIIGIASNPETQSTVSTLYDDIVIRDNEFSESVRWSQ